MSQHPKRIEHLADRVEKQGLTHREAGAEYGMSRQHVGRLLRQRAKKQECEE